MSIAWPYDFEIAEILPPLDVTRKVIRSRSLGYAKLKHKMTLTSVTVIKGILTHLKT